MFMNKIILFRVVNDEEFVLFFFSFDFVFLIFILFYILDLGKEYNIMLYMSLSHIIQLHNIEKIVKGFRINSCYNSKTLEWIREKEPCIR